jgi:hypothetical protein
MNPDEFYMALGACAALSNPFSDRDIAASAKLYAGIIRSVAQRGQEEVASSPVAASSSDLQIQR